MLDGQLIGAHPEQAGHPSLYGTPNSNNGEFQFTPSADSNIGNALENMTDQEKFINLDLRSVSESLSPIFTSVAGEPQATYRSPSPSPGTLPWRPPDEDAKSTPDNPLLYYGLLMQYDVKEVVDGIIDKALAKSETLLLATIRQPSRAQQCGQSLKLAIAICNGIMIVIALTIAIYSESTGEISLAVLGSIIALCTISIAYVATDYIIKFCVVTTRERLKMTRNIRQFKGKLQDKFKGQERYKELTTRELFVKI